MKLLEFSQAAPFVLDLLASFFFFHDSHARWQFEGTWKYYLGSMEYNNSVDCSRSFSVVKTVEMNLMTPDVVLSGSSKGFWTRIYGQGAELVIDGLKVCRQVNGHVLVSSIAIC